MNRLLSSSIPMVDFLADFLGENAEVVLHDLADLEHSIVKIRNSHISGRKVGDPATDWVIKYLQENGGKDYYCSYQGKSRDGRTLKSASLFIRDEDGAAVGVLCINLMVEDFFQIRKIMDSFLHGIDEHAYAVKENLGQTVDEMIDTSLQNALLRLNLPSTRLGQAEKAQVIEQINSDGVFQLKGAVAKVATRLRISEPTVYRYLSRLMKNGSKTQQ